MCSRLRQVCYMACYLHILYVFEVGYAMLPARFTCVRGWLWPCYLHILFVFEVGRDVNDTAHASCVQELT